MKRQIRRQPRDVGRRPGERLAIDFHDLPRDPTGRSSVMLITDRWSGMIWDYYLVERKTGPIINVLNDLFGILERQYQIKPKVIECDNEIPRDGGTIFAFLHTRHIKVEPSAPNTQAQNGGAEASGSIIKAKARAMRVGARLPEHLWVEIYRAAAYLYNRTPKYMHNWRTPAWIGFLVGYESTNIYRIWNPQTGRIISTRDVIFNEDERFDGNINQLKDDLLHIGKQELIDLLKQVEEPEADRTTMAEEDLIGALIPQTNWEGLHGEDEDVGAQLNWEDAALQEVEVDAGAEQSEVVPDQPTGTDEGFGISRGAEASEGQPEGITEDQAMAGTDDQAKNSDALTRPYPTPVSLPPTALLAMVIREVSGDPLEERFKLCDIREPIEVWKAAFVAGPKFQRLLKDPKSLHRRQMPPLPRSHADLETHLLGNLFKEAEANHLRSHDEMRSWTEISRQDLRARGNQILDCMWVYVYKFDKHGRFQKCKARLVVRGDQQVKSVHEETYAATLAGRSFRTLMAIAARFDLELIQYDAVNAFVNARLDKDIFMRMPPGYRKPGMILMLQKALYGLRESPLLWQRDLTATLHELGFKTVPHEPCCMTKGGIIFFFYVDDIVLAYRKERESEIQNCRHDIPMRRKELWPYNERASLSSIRRYQRKIGSILYAAVITRPDVAFAASRLARFNANPGPEHHAAADQVLLYLESTKTLALQFGGADLFTVASDASFADNTLDRKSSQAYIMKLFGGTIGWRANKQATVTTSTTEAELLALAQAAKEAMFISRLIKELGIRLDDQRIQIQCDNQQTIQLVNKDIAKLQTKLRHVDIHNHWLRQEAQKNRIKVEYRPTTDMIADGLTKTLSFAQFQKFVRQIGLTDMSSYLDNRRLQDIGEEEILLGLAKLELHDMAVSADAASTGGVLDWRLCADRREFAPRYNNVWLVAVKTSRMDKRPRTMTKRARTR
ncbi:hypothetical protein MRS44_013449 [Fusarium solani]|uniref:uncharacterized protein n=1 Tax=Fusarium solani TaxID=169388 RepID=UPI0032C454A5|nr:hypothetical protein MRS44_013449 [Fusarium solani]